MDTCCKTYLLAKQIGKPLHFIPDSKIEEILALKRRMGLPDARFAHSPEKADQPAGKNAAELERLVEQVATRMKEPD
jgi:hypothetical protein